MTDYSIETQGSAIAAFTLAQFAFWHQIDTGQLSTEKAGEMLSRAVKTNLAGSPGNRAAAQRLQTVLDMVLRGKIPTN